MESIKDLALLVMVSLKRKQWTSVLTCVLENYIYEDSVNTYHAYPTRKTALCKIIKNDQ